MAGDAEEKGMGRWFGRGALGYVNMVESAVADGMTLSPDALADLESAVRRLGVVVANAKGQQPPALGVVPGEAYAYIGAAGRRRRR